MKIRLFKPHDDISLARQGYPYPKLRLIIRPEISNKQVAKNENKIFSGFYVVF
jgi:hypothetical protein